MSFISGIVDYSVNLGNSLYQIAPIYLNRIWNPRDSYDRPTYFESSAWDTAKAFFASANLIVDQLYLGSAFNAADWKFLNEEGITHIINVTEEVPNFYPDNFKYYRHIIKDDGIESFPAAILSEILNFITEAQTSGGKVYIHCLVGRSRSASVILFYLMIHHDMTLEQAMLFLKEKRGHINPSLALVDNIKNSVRNLPSICPVEK